MRKVRRKLEGDKNGRNIKGRIEGDKEKRIG
jgi:hypothetical protein